jgi:hypothetical protein
MLAWRLYCEKALADFDPANLVRIGAAYLIRASLLLRKLGDEQAATFIEEYADYLEAHIEEWTTTTQGSLVEGIST